MKSKELKLNNIMVDFGEGKISMEDAFIRVKELYKEPSDLEKVRGLGKEYVIRKVCGNCTKFKDKGDQRDPWYACMNHNDRRNRYGYCNEHVYTEEIRKAMKLTYEE